MTEEKFDPMKELNRLRDSVGKVIEQGIQSVQEGIQTVQATAGTGIRLDVYEHNKNVVIRTSPMDNVIPESIEVSMEGNLLTIGGETRPDETPPNVAYLLQERRFGIVTRSVEIRIPVKAEEARAKLKNGSLTITIPIDESRYQDDFTVTPSD